MNSKNIKNLVEKYQWILFDADGTLFHFDDFSGLRHTFSLFGFQFTQQDYQIYQTTNKSLWIDYQNDQITAQQLQHKRFELWANKLEVSPAKLNSIFLAAMAKICLPIDGALSLLSSLKNKVKLGIITNGFTELQRARLEHTGFKDYFEVLIISEQVGIAKPHRGIFDYALSLMENPKCNKVLMVGDNLDSDIIGGINAGLDTCWLNINGISTNIIPSYQVASLLQLQELLLS